ncbi:DUF5906 domain-containing protein [Acinetobacter higginsii]|uniref:DUF5906 domain-containing protein n=1 Tax=Acinetobacter higginsii TaxID=70347 RepID=UPI001F4BBBC5|nr:DUF5906 domain-containing protein [Acinetobacter higginsii]MCH7381163.1 DUF5906 domain-containing protein [Acinetobacter higginsii]
MGRPKKGLDLKIVKEKTLHQWDSIYPQFGIKMPTKNRHSACPSCGGEDRFYFDDKQGFGDYFCNNCGPGDGIALIGKVTNLSLPDIIKELAAIVGISEETVITEADRERWRKEAAMRERMHKEELQKIQQNAAKKALRLWNNTHQGDDKNCKYLDKKQVSNIDCLVNFDGDLIVPLFDEKRTLWNLQYIKHDGSKVFLSGGRVKGCFHFLGAVDLVDPIICIAEGYATAASIHAATGLPVVVAFNAGNLVPVGTAIRSIEPNAKLIYCADDDSAKEDTGREAAKEAVAVTGGIVIVPVFEFEAGQLNESPVLSQQQALTDFNDLHVNFGLDAVKGQIERAIGHYGTFPAPLSPFPNNFQGHMGENVENSAVNEDCGALDGGSKGEDGTYTLNLDACLGRFCLIEGETKFWDMHRKVQIKKAAFVEMLGKTLFSEWSIHPKRKLIDSNSVKNILNKDTERLEQNMSERFVMLEGTKESWDVKRRRTVRNDTIKDNFRSGYEVWIKSDSKKMIWFEDLVFNPTMNAKAGQINMFDGLPIAPMMTDSDLMIPVKSAYEMCLPIIDLLRHTCNQDKEVVMWILKWLAYPLQNQGSKMATSILMHGEIQGAGKSLFFGKVMRDIYGKYCVTLGQNGLESIYTDWAEQKLYCLFEEIFNNKSKYGMMGLIKHMITGDTIRIEKKFMSGYEQSNHINCVFLSNDTQPLPLEERDRRFLVVKPCGKLDDELKDAVMNCIDSNGIDAFYTFLLQLDMDGFTTHTEPPVTDAKRDIIQYGLPSWKLFYQKWSTDELDIPFCCCLSTDLFRAYTDWCRKTHEKPLPENKFSFQIATIDGISKKLGRYKEQFGTHGKANERQKTIIYVGNPDPNQNLIDWVTSQIHEFSDKVHGGIPDVLHS